MGRSGTGKTTSAVLRMFAMQTLFAKQSRKRDEKLLDMRQGKKEPTLNGLHSVFITASPVLTTEVWRFYTSMSDRILYQLRCQFLERKAKAKGEPFVPPAHEEIKYEQTLELEPDPTPD